jgi:Flp pilus assembly protein TadD
VNTGQIDEAIATLEHCLKLTPSLAEAHFNLALALSGKDQLSEAEKEYSSALSLQPDYPEAASQLGKLLLQMGKANDAEQELDAALRLNPDLADAHYTLARVLRSMHRTQDAEVEFAEAKELIDRPPNGVQASNLSNQALQLAAKGDMPGAIATLHRAIALKPDYGVPHYNLGLILADTGDLPGAVQEISKAISLDPAQPRMWFDLGRVLRHANDPRAADEALSWAARLSPGDPAISAELASLRASQPTQHALDPALRQYRVRVAPDTATDHLSCATDLMARGDFEGAVGELLRALTLKPAMLEARRMLALAYAHLGQNDLAVLEDYKLLRCAPGDPGILAALRQAEASRAR